VVQHIQNFQRPRHQLSYTPAALHSGDQRGSGGGFGDVILNYRYQVLGAGVSKVAFAPRFSVLFPTGDSRLGCGAGGAGIQGALPLSIVPTSKLMTHWNAGRASQCSAYHNQVLMTPSLLQSVFRLPPSNVQLANLAGTATLCLSTFATAVATDRFGVRRVTLALLPFLVIASYALYIGAERLPSILLLYIGRCGAGGAVLAPLIMVRAFPSPVRFSGVSFSYNISYAVFGGVTPLLVS